MNLAHCIYGLGLGGAQRVISTLIRGDRAGLHRYFVYSPMAGVLQEEVESAGATVRIVSRSIPLFDPLWISKLAKAMREDSVELIHGHLFGDTLHGYLAARRLGGLPFVLTLHNNYEKFSSRQRSAYRWLICRSDATVACSKTVKSSFIRAYPELADQIQVVSNGVEPHAGVSIRSNQLEELKKSLGFEPSDLIIATIGRLADVKGHRFLLEAFSKVSLDSTHQAKLLVVGEGPLEGDLRQQASRLGISDRVTFAGFRSDVAEILDFVDIIVFSSLVEGLPLTLLEAMAARKCIIATRIPPFLEALEDGSEAILADPADPAGLVEALVRTIPNLLLRSELGATAYRRFSKEFSSEAMVEKYMAIYKGCADTDAQLQTVER